MASRSYPNLYNILFCTTDVQHTLAQEWPPVMIPQNHHRHKVQWCGLDGKLLIFHFCGNEHLDESALRSGFGYPFGSMLRMWRALSPMPAEASYDPSKDPGVTWGYHDLPTCFPGIDVLGDLFLWLLIVHSLACAPTPAHP